MIKYEQAISRLLEAGETEKALALAIKYHDRKIWVADDGNCEVEYDLDNRQNAAQTYVDEGDWNEVNSTIFIHVNTWPRYYVGDSFVDDLDDRESSMVAVHPNEPACESKNGHNWQSPHNLVGGIKENPGVWAHGGGVIIDEACIICGCKRTTDTWAQCPSTGIQGLESITYKSDYYTIHPELSFKSRFESVCEAIKAEESILSVGKDFLPQHVIDVMTGADPLDDYWEFMIENLEQSMY